MRRIGRRALGWSGAAAGATAIGLGCLAILSGCMNLQMKRAEIEDRFSRRGQSEPRYAAVADAEGKVFWAVAGEGPGVALVHGSPGSWDNYIAYFTDASLRSEYTLAAPDRPGFGRTRPKGPESSLAAQARRLAETAEAAGLPLPAVWVGHSLAGPVVARLAVDYPDAVSGLVLVAPSISPELEKRRWYNWLAKFPLVKWALARPWRNSNEEIFPLKAELEELAPRLSEIKVPTIVIQGAEDSLVDPRNAAFVERAFSSSSVEVRLLAGADHFTIWTHREAVVEAIAEAAARSRAAGE